MAALGSVASGLGGAADREVGQSLEGLTPIIVREYRQRGLGRFGIVHRKVEAGIQRTRAQDKITRPQEVRIRLIERQAEEAKAAREAREREAAKNSQERELLRH